VGAHAGASACLAQAHHHTPQAGAQPVAAGGGVWVVFKAVEHCARGVLPGANIEGAN